MSSFLLPFDSILSGYEKIENVYQGEKNVKMLFTDELAPVRTRTQHDALRRSERVERTRRGKKT